MHSLNILVKYVRLYGSEHTRTKAQFEITWTELQNGLPISGENGFLLGVSESKLLLDGIPLDSGQSERSFAQLLTTAGLASIQFSSQITKEDFDKLLRVFASANSKAQDLSKQIKGIFGDSKQSAIRINEVKFVAADPMTGEISIAAQIAAQTLGPEFKEWLNDPQKLLQLIAAAEGAGSGGSGGGGGQGTGGGGGTGQGTGTGTGSGSASNAPVWAAPKPGQGGASTNVAPNRESYGDWDGTVVPLQEEEVVQAIRLLTKFGEAANDPTVKPDFLQKELSQTDTNTKVNLQQLLNGLAGNAVANANSDTPLLMKAAEHMAIRFALDRFQKGDIKVNAVHQMLEHMSRQMDTLRRILRIQEDKMTKAGMLIESHADILDRMFWAEVPEAGKKSVLMSHEAPCVPPRNIRQFIEQLLERPDNDTAAAILKNYCYCLDSKDLEPRRKTAIGVSQLGDLYANLGDKTMSAALHKLGESLTKEQDPELQALISAAFVRLSSEASNRKQYGALSSVCEAMDAIGKQRPVLANDLRPRVGVENRLPEFIEEGLRQTKFPPELVQVLRRTPHASVEHLADRFFRCMRREECDQMMDLTQELGSSAMLELRELLRTGQPRQAASVVGLMSRLDVPSLLELLPIRLKEWSRFYHDIVVRQIAYGAAPDRGRTLLELLEVLDPLVIPQALDEIGMSGDRSSVPPLLVMAESGEAKERSPLLQVKAIESLGRLRELEAVPVLRNLLESKKRWKLMNHRELRIASAQALAKIDPRYGSQVVSDSGLEPAELAIAPLDAAPACPWVRQRRYERIALPRSLAANISSSWGKSAISIKELSLGGGMGTKEDNLRIGSEALLDIPLGMRKHIRAQVLLRRARMNEVGFEIVETDLESRYRLRELLMHAIENAPEAGSTNWNGNRKS